MIKFFTKRLNNKKGFTLIELIVVIAILGILALIAIPRFANVQKNARIDSDIATANTIVNAAKVYISSQNLNWTNAQAVKVTDLTGAKLLESAPTAQTNNIAMEITIGGTESEPTYTVTAGSGNTLVPEPAGVFAK